MVVCSSSPKGGVLGAFSLSLNQNTSAMPERIIRPPIARRAAEVGGRDNGAFSGVGCSGEYICTFLVATQCKPKALIVDSACRVDTTLGGKPE